MVTTPVTQGITQVLNRIPYVSVQGESGSFLCNRSPSHMLRGAVQHTVIRLFVAGSNPLQLDSNHSIPITELPLFRAYFDTATEMMGFCSIPNQKVNNTLIKGKVLQRFRFT